MQQSLLRYTERLFAQIVQTSVCNRRHSIEQQLCRWLLQAFDRLASRELMSTHEMLANTLGVRRERITQAARQLRRAGLINYQRGRIELINRIGLELRSCECYQVVHRAIDGLSAADKYGPQLLARGAALRRFRDAAGHGIECRRVVGRLNWQESR